VQEVARLERVSRSVREKLQTVHLEIYLQVSVVASEFSETWRLLDWNILSMPILWSQLKALRANNLNRYLKMSLNVM
jgi:hypothetical protein